MSSREAAPKPTEGGSRPARRRRSSAEIARLVMAVALTAFVAVFAVLNTSSVSIDWVFGTVETPLILLILVCVGVGLAAGIGLDRIAARRRRRSAAKR